MGAPKGNKYAVGHDTSKAGRKSYRTERANYEFLENLFFDKIDKEEVRKLIASGKYSVKDAFVARLLAGSERHQNALFNKLFPDRREITGKDGSDLIPRPLLGGLSQDNDGKNEKEDKSVEEGESSLEQREKGPTNSLE